MNLSDHLSNEGLEQLTNNLRHLNLVQIKIIRLRVQWAVIKMRAKRTALAVYYGLPNLIRKMPTRITSHGLHAGTGKPPYGYIKPVNERYNPRAILEPDPITAPIAVRIKDAYLKGQSLTSIASELNAQHIPSPDGSHWRIYTVGYILRNPFYAGIVQWGKTKSLRDRRTGKVKRIKNKPTISQGKHKPLWSADTHHQLLEQLAQRGNAHSGWRTMQLSRLLYCQCGKVMHIRYSDFYAAKGDKYWKCSSKKAGHTTFVNSRIYLLVIKQIVIELRDINSIKLPEPIDERPNLIKQIQELDRRKQRWMDAFETGSIDARDYADRVASLTAQADTNRDKLTTLESQITKNQTTRQNITKLANTLSAFANYLIEAHPSQINADLRLIISRIDIDKENQPHITWG